MSKLDLGSSAATKLEVMVQNFRTALGSVQSILDSVVYHCTTPLQCINSTSGAQFGSGSCKTFCCTAWVTLLLYHLQPLVYVSSGSPFRSLHYLLSRLRHCCHVLSLKYFFVLSNLISGSVTLCQYFN